MFDAIQETGIGLDIIGRGELKQSLVNQAKQRKIDVRFLDKVPNDQLPEYYNRYLIYVLCSRYEGNPKTLLEAMSCGCAVVSTSNCMIPEVIVHGVNGFMTNDESEMRGFLELLMRDEELAFQMGQKARETIVRDFSVDRFTSEWNDIFNEVVQ